MNNSLLYKTLKLMRVKQWIKNLAVFAAIVFTGQLFNPDIFKSVLIAFFAFCLLSSAIYVINDIFDIEKDKQHPFKRFRPLAHGDISIGYAIVVSVVLLVATFFLSLFVTEAFLFLVIVYLALQLSYSAILKHIAVLDILALAAGYIFRVYAGELASGFHISVWLVLTTVSLSLFLAVGKRRNELTLISGFTQKQIEATRTTLSHYSERLLDVYASIFVASTFIFYTLFTFLENPGGFKISLSILMPDFLPDYFQRKWLMITIIPVVYGLMRYLQDIYEKHEGESPEKVFLSDVPLLSTVFIWVLLVIGIIYFIKG
ncbi:MAG: decaprenyl-phosphate phosphoribosyltransferase [Patescibacteria group bacterium]|nr:decaprenyl-phosphate phosphoribosyltransferase [Patescibacteria group bacterium]MDE2588996.1 decaprenyl-phosphate phosphoribosyltransferase [Patescibacteria group bacterium]